MNYFKVPEKLIVDKKIFKNEFYKQGDFKNLEKKIFQDEVNQIIWKASLKENNLNKAFQIDFVALILNEKNEVLSITIYDNAVSY